VARRPCLYISILAAFTGFATGLPASLHLHIWHAQHAHRAECGPDHAATQGRPGGPHHPPRHDSERCPVFRVVFFSGKAVSAEAPALQAMPELQIPDSAPAADAPESGRLITPYPPRAPPPGA